MIRYLMLVRTPLHIHVKKSANASCVIHLIFPFEMLEREAVFVSQQRLKRTSQEKGRKKTEDKINERTAFM